MYLNHFAVPLKHWKSTSMLKITVLKKEEWTINAGGGGC